MKLHQTNNGENTPLNFYHKITSAHFPSPAAGCRATAAQQTRRASSTFGRPSFSCNKKKKIRLIFCARLWPQSYWKELRQGRAAVDGGDVSHPRKWQRFAIKNRFATASRRVVDSPHRHPWWFHSPEVMLMPGRVFEVVPGTLSVEVISPQAGRVGKTGRTGRKEGSTRAKTELSSHTPLYGSISAGAASTAAPPH